MVVVVTTALVPHQLPTSSLGKHTHRSTKIRRDHLNVLNLKGREEDIFVAIKQQSFIIVHNFKSLLLQIC